MSLSFSYLSRSRVLLAVSAKYSSGLRRPRVRPDQLVALSHQYEMDLKIMRELYKRTDEVEEVAIMKVRQGIGNMEA